MEKHSDTHLIQLLKQGNKEAANELVNRYFDRVYSAANRQLVNRRLRVSGPDDIAASVFGDLWKNAVKKKFDSQKLQDSGELWRLLSVMIENKVCSHYRYENAKKRGGGKLVGESALDGSDDYGMNKVPDDKPPDVELVTIQDEHRRLLQMLNDDILVQIATLRLEGYKVDEISDIFEKSNRWVQRKLQLIRGIWEIELKSMTNPDSQS